MTHNSLTRTNEAKNMIDSINESNRWTSVRGDILGYKPERVNELAKANEEEAYEHYEKMCLACGFYAVKNLCSYAYHDTVRFEDENTNLVKKLDKGIPGTKQDYKDRMKNRVVEGSHEKGRHLIIRNGEIACRGLVELPRITDKNRAYYHGKLQKIERPFTYVDVPANQIPEQIEFDI